MVAVDGSSEVTFEIIPDDYYISINHRNHLAIVTKTVKSLSTISTSIDFTNSQNVKGETNAMSHLEGVIYGLTSGDVDGNGQINISDYGVAIPLIGTSGYSNSDLDMNNQINTIDPFNFLLISFGKGIQF